MTSLWLSLGLVLSALFLLWRGGLIAYRSDFGGDSLILATDFLKSLVCLLGAMACFALASQV